VPSLADLALRAGDFLAVVVDAEVATPGAVGAGAARAHRASAQKVDAVTVGFGTESHRAPFFLAGQSTVSNQPRPLNLGWPGRPAALPAGSALRISGSCVAWWS
jgi:hypothetical protein